MKLNSDLWPDLIHSSSITGLLMKGELLSSLLLLVPISLNYVHRSEHYTWIAQVRLLPRRRPGA